MATPTPDTPPGDTPPGDTPPGAVPNDAAPPSTGGAAAGDAVVNGAPLLELRNVSKFFGSVIAIKDVSTTVRAGEVTCVLGDNGAGKSTLIKILAGVYQPDGGELLVDGEPARLASPRDALDRGIATVYQDLAMIPLMAVWRNFFLGSEPTRRFGPFRWFDVVRAKRVTRAELADMGIDIRDPDQPVGTLSGGERQSVAIARAVHFGARLLILDEPTSALGVKQAGVVLRYIAQARDRGLGVIFITHNPHHAFPVGDRFLLLKRGRSLGDFAKDEISREELTRLMAGGAELEDLAHELQRSGVTDAAAALESDARDLGV
jgi:simple sugar transport system ATP-binding protein